MAKITIEVSRPEDRQLIENLLERLDIPIQTEEEPASGKRVASIMQELADRQSFDQIKDPVAWQQEVRQDRPLPSRN